MNTPAVTIVAAWISAETGVGPSMASGSQVCSGTCADFPIAPMKRSRQTTVIAPAPSYDWPKMVRTISLPSATAAALAKIVSRLTEAKR